MTAEARWALIRAFAPVEFPWTGSFDPSRAAEVVRALDLAPRIATRIPSAQLRAEAGERAACTLTAARGLAALAASELLELAREVAAEASARAIPLVLLKGIALHARGLVPRGARFMSDVDVLVPERAVELLAGALRQAGFATLPGSVECEHQIAPLSRGGLTLEIHRFLPGVTPPGEARFATADSLARRGALEALPGWPSGSAVPRQPVLAAHALVHGIAQHGFAPRSYPLTRMLADLVDLGGFDLEQARDWIARHVSADECAAALELALRLAAGDVPDASPLLAHAILGLTDDRYAESLRLRALGSVPSLLPRPLALVRDAWRSLFPGRERLLGLYGRGGSGLGRAVRRPLDLAFRLGRLLST